jgi:alkanesulfonate monooxygenase SsuD/methylene tetrahydromethanopterin reductase-like flavin-dependent oxidoreductase (luciferase family)
MIEIGIFTTGCSDMPFTTSPSGIRVPDATLAEVNASAQRVTNDQIRQAVLADRLGFDYFWMSEHHFILEGSELSPNPLQSQTAIAALTKRIRLGQAANILPWHHPLRLAEQISLLDVISGGRTEVGFGRGYQPRETELFGFTYGSSHADQERNRMFFDEAFELIKTAWTEESFSFRGDFFSVPPRYLKWGHPVTQEYFAAHANGRQPSDVLGPESGVVQVSPTAIDDNSYLRQISSLPRPVQQPHPPLWQLMVSPRSIQNAAQHGFNGYFNLVSNQMLKEQIDGYMKLCESYGWPDMLDRGEFKPGWDADKHRGLVTGRWLHCDQPGVVGNPEKFREGLRRIWNWYDPFGFGVLVNGDQSIPTKVEDLEEKGLALIGSKDQIIEAIMDIKNTVYQDSDFYFNCQFEGSGMTGAENEEQIQFFAEEIAPVLRQECGGGIDLPDSTVQLVPEQVAATAS